MNPWLIILGGAAGAWWILRRHERPVIVNTEPQVTSVLDVPQFQIMTTPTAQAAPAGKKAAPVSPSANSSVWLDHVKGASDLVVGWHDANTAGVDTSNIKAQLQAPIDTLTLQRDLNLLGATPALVEDGIMGPVTTQAVKDFQKQGNIPITGTVDPATAFAVRYAVGEHVTQSAANT